MATRALAEGKKNARRRGAWIVFEDESGLSLNPALRRTWAPRGQTPVLSTRFGRRKKMSMAGFLAYRPDGSRARVLLHTYPGAYTDEVLIDALGQLRRHLRAKVVVIWDLLNSHRSRVMKAWLRSNRHWITVEELPPYAYDLNPCEALWANLKACELANLCPDTVEECVDAAQAGIRRVRRNEQLAFNFLSRSGLPL